MTITKHVDSWGWELCWAVEAEGAVVFTAKTRKACKEWVLSQGGQPLYAKSKIVKEH